MEAQKTLDKISTDWVLWKRELDRDIIESDRNSELHYAQEHGLNQGIRQGINQGRQEGTKQPKREDARNMKNDGLTVSKIAEYTGLTEEKIAKL